jgi:diaminopimelate epimerase
MNDAIAPERSSPERRGPERPVPDGAPTSRAATPAEHPTMAKHPTMAEHPTMAKYHGIGNDFLVLLDPGSSVALDAVTARRWCDRHRGIGADGVIRVRPAPAGSDAVLCFELWNADGSEAEMSGNGMRCLAHAALDAGLVPPDEPFGVLTPAGRREVTIRRTGEGTVWAGVKMGRAVVDQGGAQCNVGHGHLLVDMGNPHLVVAGPDPTTVDVGVLGPELEAGAPAGRNVEFVTLGPGPDEVTMRVWERGVGETQACGTGSCAAAVAFHHWGRVGSRVTVHQPGGAVSVEIGPGGEVTLAGTSERIAGVLPDGLVSGGTTL